MVRDGCGGSFVCRGNLWFQFRDGNEAAGLTISAEPPTRSPRGSRLKKFAFVRNEMVKYDRNDSCTA